MVPPLASSPRGDSGSVAASRRQLALAGAGAGAGDAVGGSTFTWSDVDRGDVGDGGGETAEVAAAACVEAAGAEVAGAEARVVVVVVEVVVVVVIIFCLNSLKINRRGNFKPPVTKA